MSKENIALLGKSVGFVVAMDKKGAIKVLEKFSVNTNRSDDEVTSALIQNIVDNDNFFFAFQKLLANNIKVANKVKPKSYNFVGTNSGGSMSSGSSFDWGGTIGGVLNAGTNIFTSIKASEAQKKLAEQQAKIEREKAQSAISVGNQQIEIEKIRLAQIQAQSASGSSPSKALLYGGIGLGVLMFVGLIVVIVKK